MNNKYRIIIATALIVSAFTVIITLNTAFDLKIVQGPVKSPYKTVIIDAGHGGEDGGAVGVDGVIEKDLNLPIALKTAEMLKKSGINVVLTRDDDYAVYSEEAKSIREKKVSDIHNRFKLIESTEDCIFVSIHMNHYESQMCNGAQTFYSGNNEESRALAQSIQTSIKTMLQPNNERMIKQSTSSIYLLYYAQVPAVLVECGFISNPEESKKLQDKQYQEQMAFSIYEGILSYLGEEPKQELNPVKDSEKTDSTKESKTTEKATKKSKGTEKATTTEKTTASKNTKETEKIAASEKIKTTEKATTSENTKGTEKSKTIEKAETTKKSETTKKQN